MPKKILVTGGAGFIGSHLVDGYLEQGFQVVVVDNFLTGKQENLNPSAKFYEIDISSPKLEEIFAAEKFDYISHHAAQASARYAISEPIFDAQTNILGTINVLENSLRFGIKKIIFASSVAVYGEQEYFPANESHPRHPVNPYGVAKFAAEEYFRYYNRLFNLDYCIFRYANVYGPRQDPFGEGGVVAVFSQKFLANEQPLINGDGLQTRDFIYVGDIVRANITAVENGVSDTLNLSTGAETSVLDLFNNLKNVTASSYEPMFGPAKEGDQRRSLIDYAAAKTALGWEPETALVDGLQLTVDHFKIPLR